MKVAIVIPGIMGTRLHLPTANGQAGTEVWPPTPSETVFGYDRITELQRKDLVVGKLIDSVLCYDFYNLLTSHLNGLKFVADAQDRRLVEFAYDWRQDNFLTADSLAATIKDLYQEGAEEISLFAHSMGGLVARLLLEGGKFEIEPWFTKIRLFGTLGTPHLGAPLALARIFGLDSSLGISGKEFAALAANRDYPSGYQLMPAPGEAAIWNMQGQGRSITPLDPYDPATAADLGMDQQLIDRAKAVYNALSTDKMPAHVRCIYFAGTGHRTVTRINVFHERGCAVDHGKSVVTRTDSAGDGTVPLYSALPARGQRQIASNEHATVFRGQAFRKVLFRLFGEDAGSPFEATAGERILEEPYLQLSFDKQVYELDEAPELVITVVDPYQDGGHVEAIRGDLVIQELDEQQKEKGAPVRRRLVVEAPSVSEVTLRLTGISSPGLYRLSFEGNIEPENPIAFVFRSK